MEVKPYGKIGVIDRLINSVKKSFRKGYVVINCSKGMNHELKEFMR